jgi:hypothetical protein
MACMQKGAERRVNHCRRISKLHRASQDVLRHCVMCGCWFTAKRMHAETCSDRCRKARSRLLKREGIDGKPALKAVGTP